VFGHFDLDGVVGVAVVEHFVNDVALGARELGDFAGGLAAAGLEGRGGGFGGWLRRGKRLEGRRDLRFRIHGS